MFFQLKAGRPEYEGNSVLTLTSQFSRENSISCGLRGLSDLVLVCMHSCVGGDEARFHISHLCVSPDVWVTTIIMG